MDTSKAGVDHFQMSDDTTMACQVSEERLKSLNEKLSQALLDNTIKDNLVKQHAKVAEEAVSGWEKAEREAMALKQQFDTVTQQKFALEDRVSHLVGALKECMRELRNAREDTNLKELNDALLRVWPHGDFERFPFSHGSKQEMVMLDEQTEWERWSFQQLMSDGCDLLGKYVLPQYFVLAKILLLKTRQITNEYDNMSIICPKSIAWWSSRLLLVQQKLLDERSRSLHDQLQVTMEETLKHFGQSTNVMGYWENELHKGDASDIVAVANLEAGIKELVYSYVDRARQFFKQAEAACGLRLSVTGALGFRTVH
ncbi:hypothetical protein SUGI_1103510 [Cryptomeria japonica]|nr:hypothetical protein SUGI_1103510 [Cryptomeria japonica]